ncbi:cation transporter [bacterium]|nr:cation transporter [bacterium]NCQ55663.1 cation transporter [Candidatus Parcubacteria bacterium]NCS67488.1 cation transporter [Candidatus Peregrinibacteria bacterium]NCS96214.1 cation transporter [bacterium]
MPHQIIARKTILLSLVSNFFLAIIKFTAGILGNSYALIADAIESTVDVFSSILMLVGLEFAAKPADKNHPYGHGKIEPLLAFVVVLFLVFSAGIIAYGSIQNILHPGPGPKAWTLWILAAIIFWKEGCFQWLKRKSITTHSTVLLAEAWHHRSDAITSLLAFIGIVAALVLGEGYEMMDDYAALLASGIIVYNSFKLLRPALGEIMDEHLYEDMIDDIRSAALKVKGVVDTEKCFIRKAGMKYQVDLHLIVDGDITVRAGHDIAHNLQDYLHEQMPELGSVIIHVEPKD